jgi:thioredoxin reductase (NADPH)
MAVLSRADLEQGAVALPSSSDALVVVSLCAAWCDVCREFAQGYARLAAGHPAAVYVWLDIEDDAELCGDVDVENFPTLAVFRGGEVLHYGTTLPSEAGVARLIAAVVEREASLDVAEEVVELGEKLHGLLRG